MFKCVLMKTLLDAMCAKTYIYNTALLREHSQQKPSEDSIRTGQRDPVWGQTQVPLKQKTGPFLLLKAPKLLSVLLHFDFKREVLTFKWSESFHHHVGSWI